MFRRLFPLLLAMIVGVTPAAREICLMSCGETDTVPAASAHSHHGAGHSMAGHDMSGHDIGAPDAAPSSAPRHTGLAVGHQHVATPLCEPSVSSGPSPCLHAVEWQGAQAQALATKLVIAAPAFVAHLDEIPFRLTTGVLFASRSTSARASVPLALRTPLRV
jgi:hypothetical protein